MECRYCGNKFEGYVEKCPACGTEQKNTCAEPKIPIYGVTTSRPMKWYKYLIYFSLIFSAISNLFDACLCITGKCWDYFTYFEYTSEQVYSEYSAMQFVDVVSGIASLAAAIYCIFVRMALARFKKYGPFMLYGLYAINLILQIGYSLGISYAAGFEFDYAQYAGSLIGCIIIIRLNWIYFQKRADMFVG